MHYYEKKTREGTVLLNNLSSKHFMFDYIKFLFLFRIRCTIYSSIIHIIIIRKLSISFISHIYYFIMYYLTSSYKNDLCI